VPQDLDIDGRVVIPGDALSWTSVRSSGPGGQNVNKVATKVVLELDLDRVDVLSAAQKKRLRQLAGNRINAEGRLIVTSQETRNRVRNLEDARAKLAALIRQCLKPPKKRRPTKPSRRAKQRRLSNKRKRSEKKRLRGKVDY
jgi:ribosome-associated protein